MNKYKKLLSNTLIFGIGTFSSKVMVYLLMPLYTALLSKAEYSTADLITQAANLLMPLAAIGMYDGIFRFAIDAGEKKKEVYSSGMAVLLLGSVVFTLLSPILWQFDYFEGYNWLIVVFVITANLQCAVSFYVRGLGYTKMYALQGIINTALNIALNVIFLVCFDMGVLGYVLSVVVANVLVTLFLIVAMKLWRDFDIKLVTKQTVVAMLKYSVPLIPNTVFIWVNSVANRFIVAHFCGNDVNGLFAAALKIPTAITLLTTIFTEAWQLSAVTDADENGRGSFYSSVFKSYLGLICMAGSALIALSKVFTVLLMDVSYYEAWQYMPTMIISTVFLSLATFMGSVYLVKKKSVMSLVTSMTGAAVNILVTVLLIPVFAQEYGLIVAAQGAAVGSIAGYFAVYLIRAINAQSYVKFNTQPLKLILNTLLLAVQASIMVLEINGWVYYQIALFTVIIVINMKPIIDGIMPIIKKFLFKKSTNN
jgi:O-antigen/teichoic acid export membrane protein